LPAHRPVRQDCVRHQEVTASMRGFFATMRGVRREHGTAQRQAAPSLQAASVNAYLEGDARPVLSPKAEARVRILSAAPLLTKERTAGAAPRSGGVGRECGEAR
jgi:hypothetical protein